MVELWRWVMVPSKRIDATAATTPVAVGRTASVLDAMLAPFSAPRYTS